VTGPALRDESTVREDEEEPDPTDESVTWTPTVYTPTEVEVTVQDEADGPQPETWLTPAGRFQA
jgi:hypothetical protein